MDSMDFIVTKLTIFKVFLESNILLYSLYALKQVIAKILGQNILKHLMPKYLEAS